MNKMWITKSANNIKDIHMRFVFQQFAKSLLALDTQFNIIQEEINKPLDLKIIEDGLNSKIAQQMVTLNQSINQKLNEFNNTIGKYVAIFNENKPQDNIDVNKQVMDIMSLVNKIEERLIKLESANVVSEKKVNAPDVIIEPIEKPKKQPKKPVKTKTKVTKTKKSAWAKKK